jgi:hypothetical protein
MRRWDEKLWLLTPDEFDALPQGVMLQGINRRYVVKGRDRIDLDVRAGCMAYGLTRNLAESQNLDQEFLILMLKS